MHRVSAVPEQSFLSMLQINADIHVAGFEIYWKIFSEGFGALDVLVVLEVIDLVVVFVLVLNVGR